MPSNNEAIITVDPGDNSYKILSKLSNNKLIKNRFSLKVFMILSGKHRELKPGKYLVKSYTNPISIINKMIAHDALLHKVTIPEGLTVSQIISILKNTENLFGSPTVEVSEGWLFPDTYYFKYGDNIDSIISLMKNKSKDVINELWLTRDLSNPVKTIEDIMILASMIEKEAKDNSEKTEIAGVFTNRLRHNMYLQSDPTVIYAITGGSGDLGRLLTKKDLKFPSNYNTYYVKLLPYGPIANPGRESINAALKPNKTDNFYFVSNNNGMHFFSRTLDEHNIARRRVKKNLYKN